ncbi:MAG: S8/S53 family peptidase [Bifidobacteriaceae bacterium]|jgi:hypothetical protein|nr:S8/S53 family peptidase [Bifidobacteriaceae bacterium]
MMGAVRWVSGRSRAVLAVGLAGWSVLAGGVAPARAADALNWYYDQTGVAEVVADGFDGRGLTIAVLDGPIDTGLAVFADADIEVRSVCGYPPGLEGLDPNGPGPGDSTRDQLIADAPSDSLNALSHGTTVTALLVGNGASVNGTPGPKGVAPKAKIIHYVTGSGLHDSVASCLRDGNDLGGVGILETLPTLNTSGADIVTTSMGGELEDKAVDFEVSGMLGFQALRNSQEGIDGVMSPDFHPGLVYVRGSQPDGELPERLHFEEPLTTVVAPGGTDSAGLTLTPDGWVVEEMGGNSAATPILAGIMADLWVKYPDATSNQLLQSLVRNTIEFDHEPHYTTTWGWGPVDVPHLFSVDPTQYPDANPLTSTLGVINETPTTAAPSPKPTSEDSSPPSEPATAEPSPTQTVAAQPEDRRDQSSRFWVSLAAAVVVAGGFVAAALIVTKRKRFGKQV